MHTHTYTPICINISKPQWMLSLQKPSLSWHTLRRNALRCLILHANCFHSYENSVHSPVFVATVATVALAADTIARCWCCIANLHALTSITYCGRSRVLERQVCLKICNTTNWPQLCKVFSKDLNTYYFTISFFHHKQYQLEFKSNLIRNKFNYFWYIFT